MKTRGLIYLCVLCCAVLALAACNDSDDGGLVEGDACTSSGDCGNGLICEDVCVPGKEPGTGGGPGEGDACDADNPCDSGFVCKDNACVEDKDASNNPGGEGDACDADNPCESGLVCKDNACVEDKDASNNPGEEGDACDADNPCDSGLDCDGNICTKPEPHTRLVGVKDIDEGPGCDSGGIDIVSGLDENDDGVLQDAEIDAHDAVCSVLANDPKILAEAENLEEGDADCPNGGLKITIGLDTSNDGALHPNDPMAQVQEITTCRSDVDQCDNSEPLYVEHAGFDAKIFNALPQDENFDYVVQLSRALDDATVDIRQNQDGFMDDADFDANVSHNDDGQVIVDYTTDVSGPGDLAVLLIQDACGVAVVNQYLPTVNDNPQWFVSGESGEFHDGDSYEVCSVSKGMDDWDCNVTVWSAPSNAASVTPIDPNGCADVTLTDYQLDDDKIQNVMVHCEDPDGPQTRSSFLQESQVPVLKGPTYMTSKHFPVPGGAVRLKIEQSGMVSCEVEAPDGSIIQMDDLDSPVWVPAKQTGDVRVTCEDADGETYTKTLSQRVIVGRGLTSIYGTLFLDAQDSTVAHWAASVQGLYVEDAECTVSLDADGFDLIEKSDDLNVGTGHQSYLGFMEDLTNFAFTGDDEDIEGTVTVHCENPSLDYEETVTRDIH